MFLVAAGSGAATLGVPDPPVSPPAPPRDTVIARFNDRDDVYRCFKPDAGIAAVIVEPVHGNMGASRPSPASCSSSATSAPRAAPC